MTEAPEATEKPTVIARVATVLLILFSALMWATVLDTLAAAGPPFQRIFDKFEITGGLPWTTDFLIGSAQVLNQYWYLFGLGIVAVVAWLIWAGMRRDRLGQLLVLAIASFASLHGAVVLTFIGLMLPLMKLVKALEAG